MVALSIACMTGRSWAQDDNEAMGLVAKAMDAYSNLQMDEAKSQLEKALAMEDTLNDWTMAKIYVSFGVLWVGGYQDTMQAEDSFVAALCYDSTIRVDPLFSTPDIDMMYTRAKSTATPALCAEKGWGSVSLPPCGEHAPIREQKRRYEFPFFLTLSPDIRYKVSSIVVHYAFDSGDDFNLIELNPVGGGFGAVLDCETGDILLRDPSTVSYYIEGVDTSGTPVCSNGSEKDPLGIVVGDEASPYPPVSGLIAKECRDCGPLNPCRGDTPEGEVCTVTKECQVGLVCGDDFKCRADEKTDDDDDDDEPPVKGKGPSKFYVNLMGGSGFGIMSKDMKIRRADLGEDADPRDYLSIQGGYTLPGEGAIETIDADAKGAGWNGIPIRLAVGLFVTPKLSIELSGRVDAFVITNIEPVSCWEDSGGNLDQMIDITPTGEVDELGRTIYNRDTRGICRFPWHDPDPVHFDALTNDQKETLGRHAVALDANGNSKTKHKNQVAWLVNARVRYQLLTKNALRASVFGGVGYGYVHYKVNSTSGTDEYFPLIGMVNIEFGPGLAYYFTKNLGLVFDLPITFLVGDGFAVNFDFNLGLGVGF